MEILKPGQPKEWTTDVVCTGDGNGGFGCDALLRVNRSDLRYYEGTDYPIARRSAVCMRCPVEGCGRVTDLRSDVWPSRVSELKPFTTAWARGTEETNND
jgi:hypothetical protein